MARERSDESNCRSQSSLKSYLERPRVDEVNQLPGCLFGDVPELRLRLLTDVEERPARHGHLRTTKVEQDPDGLRAITRNCLEGDPRLPAHRARVLEVDRFIGMESDAAQESHGGRPGLPVEAGEPPSPVDTEDSFCHSFWSGWHPNIKRVRET
jgi:hypothetical protein